MILSIDPGAPEPPFEQLRAQLLARVRSGDLQPGTRLPAVRRLAADLGLSPNTVARAYRELEARGILETEGRRGTRVAPLRPAPPMAPRARELAEAHWAAMQELGLDLREAMDLLRDVGDAEGNAARER